MIYVPGMKFFVLALVLAAACGKDDSSKASPPEAAPRPPKAPEPAPHQVEVPPAKVAEPPTKRDDGACKVEITGSAKVAEEVSHGGISAVSVSYWSDAATRKMLWRDGKEGFIVNCDGPRASISFTASGSKEALPFAAKRYPVLKGASDGVHMLGRIKDADHASLMGAEGTFEITAIDATHIAGTFEVKAKTLGDGPPGEAVIKGSFDYKCPSVCQH